MKENAYVGDFSHLTDRNEARMVHLGQKPESERSALVQAQVSINAHCAQKLLPTMVDEISRTARFAGIQAAKQTSILIPLCHQVPLRGVEVIVHFDQRGALFTIQASAHTVAATGVEMEAMCAASIAAVTIYDMVKGADPHASIGGIWLVEKKGGKEGHWLRPSPATPSTP